MHKYNTCCKMHNASTPGLDEMYSWVFLYKMRSIWKYAKMLVYSINHSINICQAPTASRYCSKQ